MVQVLFSPDGKHDFDALPATLQVRVRRVLERLQHWPDVSGAKPLKAEWAGHYRIRTGDWRVVFHVVTPKLIVVRIQHRSTVYED